MGLPLTQTHLLVSYPSYLRGDKRGTLSWPTGNCGHSIFGISARGIASIKAPWIFREIIEEPLNLKGLRKGKHESKNDLLAGGNQKL